MTITAQGLITWLNAKRGRKCRFSKAMGRSVSYADKLCKGFSLDNIDIDLAEKCIREIEMESKIVNKEDRCEVLRRICSENGMANKLAKYTGVSKQAMSIRLRNKQTISDKQWCMIKQFAREHGYGL